MGVFILCWLPFFVTNILIGVCPDSCISDPELVFSIVTWLGWLNSGMNPVIYACWSRDFRRAFKKILCSALTCCRPSSTSGDSFYGSAAYYGTPAAAAAAAAMAASHSAACRTHSSLSPGDPANHPHHLLQHRNEQNSFQNHGKVRRDVKQGSDVPSGKMKSEEGTSRRMPEERKSSSASTSSSGKKKKRRTSDRSNSVVAIEFDSSNGRSNQINVETVSAGVASPVEILYRQQQQDEAKDDENVIFGNENRRQDRQGLEKQLVSGLRRGKEITGAGLDTGKHGCAFLSNDRQRQRSDQDEEDQQRISRKSISGCEVNPLQVNDLSSDQGDHVVFFLHPHQLASEEGHSTRKDEAAQTMSRVGDEEGNGYELNHKNPPPRDEPDPGASASPHSASGAYSSTAAVPADNGGHHCYRKHGSHCRYYAGDDGNDDDELCNVRRSKEEKGASSPAERAAGKALEEKSSEDDDCICKSDGDNLEHSANDSSSTSSSEGIIGTVTIMLHNTIIIRSS